MRFHAMISGAVALCAASPMVSLANDTTAELKTGGIVFATSSDVRMLSEDLYISPSSIRVDYVFRNDGKEDVETLIAFPMPDISGTYEGDVAMPDATDNFLDLRVTQDRQPIEPTLQQRAYTPTGLDVTEDLVSKNVPLLPNGSSTFDALEKLAPETLAAFRTKGIVIDDVYDQGKGIEHHPRPIWTLKSVYYWKTRFPVGKEVKVHHDYRPSVGGTNGIGFVMEGQPNVDIFQDYQKRFCIDDGFVQLANKLQAKTATGGPNYMERWLSYVLTTGANWAGPIGRLHLTIDKEREEDFVSFCGKDVVKTGPTTFEMQVENFVPQQDIDILFLVRGAD